VLSQNPFGEPLESRLQAVETAPNRLKAGLQRPQARFATEQGGSLFEPLYLVRGPAVRFDGLQGSTIDFDFHLAPDRWTDRPELLARKSRDRREHLE
jgi:hypothetical protein